MGREGIWRRRVWATMALLRRPLIAPRILNGSLRKLHRPKPGYRHDLSFLFFLPREEDPNLPFFIPTSSVGLVSVGFVSAKNRKRSLLRLPGVSGSQELEIKQSPSRVARGRRKLLLRDIKISSRLDQLSTRIFIRNDLSEFWRNSLRFALSPPLVHSHSSLFSFLSFCFILRGAGPSLIG